MTIPHTGYIGVIPPKGWIGVDLDGTLATYDTWKGPEHIGEPIAAMIWRVKNWLERGYEVRILTARVSGDRQGVGPDRTTEIIEQWCEQHIGQKLRVTCMKDFGMIALFDDRAYHVVENTGEVIGLKKGSLL